MFSLRQIHYFIAVAETGQISKAALRCSISQSSMTIALQGLEEDIGTPLFVRHAKGLRLSDAGERFLRHAQTIEGAAHRALEDMQQPPVHAVGVLRIGVTDTISAYLMPALQVAMRRRFPGLSMLLVERERADVEQAVAEGDVDLGIVLMSNLADLTVRHDLVGETMLRSPRQLWVAPDHPLAGADSVTLEQVAEQNFLLLDMDEHVHTARLYWARHGMQVPVQFQSKSIEGIRSMVALGIGVTILSDLVYRPWSLEGGRIVRRPVRDAVPTMDVGVIWSATRPLSGQAEPVRDFLRMTLKAE